MLHFTPLRYPGGKRRLAAAVVRLLRENGLSDVRYAEPFAGGAGVAFGLLLGEYASELHLNDLARPVYAIWHTVLNEPAWLCDRIRRTPIDMGEWRRCRAVYENRDAADLGELGYAALFLNRCNRSGIVGGGPIGGHAQAGRWKLDVRFNKSDICDRIARVARYRSRVHLHRKDGCDFLREDAAALTGNVLTFVDPPYIEMSRGLYLSNFTAEGHRRLAAEVEQLPNNWIVTYDEAAARERLYEGRRRLTFELTYVSHRKKLGREVMFFSDGLRLPPAAELVPPRMSLVTAETDAPRGPVAAAAA